MQDIIIGICIGLAIYHILLKKILNKKEPGKLKRILDIVNEKKELKKVEDKEENFVFRRVK